MYAIFIIFFQCVFANELFKFATVYASASERLED